MDIKEMLNREYALKHTKLAEDFEEGQPELYSDAAVLNSGPPGNEYQRAYDKAINMFKDAGADAADGQVSRILQASKRLLRLQYQSKNIDLEAQAANAGYDDVDDYLDDSDNLMELSVELAAAFEDGMSTAWFYPVGMSE